MPNKKKPIKQQINSFDIGKYQEMTKFHLEQVKETTGEITVEDVDYCMKLTERIWKFQNSKELVLE